MDDRAFACFLSDSETTVEKVEEAYKRSPPPPLVNAHMLEDLLHSANPHRRDIARFLHETNRLRMGGNTLYKNSASLLQ